MSAGPALRDLALLADDTAVALRRARGVRPHAAALPRGHGAVHLAP